MPKLAEVEKVAEIVEQEKPAETRLVVEVAQQIEVEIKAPVETEKPVVQPQIEEKTHLEAVVEETVSFTISSSKPVPEPSTVSVIHHFHQRFIIL